MGREPLNEMQRSVIYRSVFVWMTLMFSTGAVTGSRKMKVHVKWLSRMGSLTQSTNMDGSPTLFLSVHPKVNNTPLVKPSCSQEAPWGKINSYGVNPMYPGMNQALRKPESGECLSALRSWSANLPFIRVHHSFVVDGIILSKIQLQVCSWEVLLVPILVR